MGTVRCSWIFVILFSGSAMFAEDPSSFVSSDGLWRSVSEERIVGSERPYPKAYRLVELDVDAFRRIVANAPLEFTVGARELAPSMTLPMPDGTFATFRVEESPIMEPALAVRLPGVRTYRAQGIDAPEVTARLDFTPEGFHGFILAPGGTVYIDPYRRGDIVHYITYWRQDYERPADATPFQCDVTEPHGLVVRERSRIAPAAATGAVMRTYRLALACTGEYAAYYGGTVAGAQAGMVTTMNRVNGIYETEVAVRMIMVDNTPVCFTNPSTDPYLNNSSSSDLAANQAALTNYIGPDNYDVGHLFRTGGGGSAYRAIVCNESYKAQGQTGASSPIGDPFNVDYVAHEMGHQFAASHSFNGTTAGCGITGGRSPSHAFEPGSGSTIMSYSGLCQGEDLQYYSDPQFHAIGFDQIVEFTSGVACGAEVSTGNTPPTLSAGSTVKIPASTPFYLTGSATDADNDPLTYSWEEFDLGVASPPNTDSGNRPIFRSFPPVTTPTRTFPRLPDLLANTTTFGESMPMTKRTMVFRFTVRDSRGGTNTDDRVVSVTDTAGPFLLTAPNTNVAWPGGSTQTVVWSVAGTTAAPVNCANVMILLSTDGGLTFSSTLLANTANDGAQDVTIPNVVTNTARIRVECATAPFFDISDVDFSIYAPLTVVATATTTTSVAISYTTIPNAVSYEIFRRHSSAAYTLIGTSVTTSFNDSSTAANNAYLYAVKSVDGMGVRSPLSNPDLATTFAYTNPTVNAQMTRIEAAHITELRTGANAVRSLAGLSSYVFTDPTLAIGNTARAVHITELRTAIDAALAALGLTAPVYTDATLTSQNTLIRTWHILDLRTAIK